MQELWYEIKVQTLMEANAAGKKWIEQRLPPGLNGRSWTLEGSDRIAQHHWEQNALIIAVEGTREVVDSARAEAEKKKLKGF